MRGRGLRLSMGLGWRGGEVLGIHWSRRSCGRGNSTAVQICRLLSHNAFHSTKRVRLTPRVSLARIPAEPPLFFRLASYSSSSFYLLFHSFSPSISLPPLTATSSIPPIMPPLGPYTLLTVNPNPTRAQRIIASFITEVQDTYIIGHVGNCAEITELQRMLEELRPDILFCASTWTPPQSDEIVAIAGDVVPDIKIHVVPKGLVEREGERAMVEYLMRNLGGIMEG